MTLHATKTQADYLMDIAIQDCMERQSPIGLTALKLALREMDKEGKRTIDCTRIADMLESVGC